MLRDAINATMKDCKVVSATQAEFNDELDNIMRKATWVDITKGMELSERVEYKQESCGRAFMLDPNNPEVLNFADKQSVKLLNTAVTGGLVYTMAFLVSLGEMAYMPTEDDIDSLETNVFEQDIVDSGEEEIGNKGVITNLVDITQLSQGKGPLNNLRKWQSTTKTMKMRCRWLILMLIFYTHPRSLPAQQRHTQEFQRR